MADKEPFAIAGLWREWADRDGLALSFTMLKINADTHPLMRRFHRPGDQKRSVVIVPRMHYGDWLSCRDSDVAHTFLNSYPAELLTAQASPLPPRQQQAKPQAT
jgi:putative SOS response-associated peptidase YedK